MPYQQPPDSHAALPQITRFEMLMYVPADSAFSFLDEISHTASAPEPQDPDDLVVSKGICQVD